MMFSLMEHGTWAVCLQLAGCTPMGVAPNGRSFSSFLVNTNWHNSNCKHWCVSWFTIDEVMFVYTNAEDASAESVCVCVSLYNLTAAAGTIMMVVSTGWLLGNNYLSVLCLHWISVCVCVSVCMHTRVCVFLKYSNITVKWTRINKAGWWCHQRTPPQDDWQIPPASSSADRVVHALLCLLSQASCWSAVTARRNSSSVIWRPATGHGTSPKNHLLALPDMADIFGDH